MRGLRFDPSKAVTFDLESGLVHLAGTTARVLVPAGGLRALCAAAGPTAAAALGREMGIAMGQRLAARLAAAPQDPPGGSAPSTPGAASSATPHDRVRAASLETIVEHLGGELALAGLGALSVERWGRALMAILERTPLGSEADRLLEALLEGALEAAAGRAVRAVVVGREAERARFLLANAAAAQRARGWLAEGATWGDVLVRLHRAQRGAA